MFFSNFNRYCLLTYLSFLKELSDRDVLLQDNGSVKTLVYPNKPLPLFSPSLNAGCRCTRGISRWWRWGAARSGSTWSCWLPPLSGWQGIQLKTTDQIARLREGFQKNWQTIHILWIGGRGGGSFNVDTKNSGQVPISGPTDPSPPLPSESVQKSNKGGPLLKGVGGGVLACEQQKFRASSN